MKTLFININNEQILSNDELEVLKHDLESDFFFYLGEKIAKGCKVENENALVTDFNTQDNAENYQKIIAQWHDLKTILFSEKCEGEFKFALPDGYIHWLRYSGKYNHVHDKNFSHGEPTIITIDLEELYEDSVEDLQRKILRKLQRYDLYREIDEIVFNDDVVTRKSPIVYGIKEKYDGIGFKSYKKWLQDNDEKPHAAPQICEKCKKNPCECNIEENDLFPFLNVVLGETSIDDILNGNVLIEEYKGYKGVGMEDGIEFITYPYSDKISTLCLNNLPVEKLSFPKKLSDKWGINWSSSYNDSLKELSKRNYCILSTRKDYKIRASNTNCDIKGNHYLIVAQSPNNEYVLELIFKELSLESGVEHYLDKISVHLNKCPICGKDYIGINNDEYPVTYECQNSYCGYKWKFYPDDEIEFLTCPDCCSDDIEVDNMDYLLYTCNDCGHTWRDDEINERNTNELIIDNPFTLKGIFPICGITLNKSTVKDVQKQKDLYDKIEYDDDTDTVNVWTTGGHIIRKEEGCNVFTNIYLSNYREMLPELQKFGFDWDLSYNDWILLLKKLNCTVIQIGKPVEFGGALYAELVAITNDCSLKFKLCFDEMDEGESGGPYMNSPSTLYSIAIYSNKYKQKQFLYDSNGYKKITSSIETFYNIENLFKSSPNKYL